MSRLVSIFLRRGQGKQNELARTSARHEKRPLSLQGLVVGFLHRVADLSNHDAGRVEGVRPEKVRRLSVFLDGVSKFEGGVASMRDETVVEQTATYGKKSERCEGGAEKGKDEPA
jgi:hypothetical protein